MFAAIAIVCAGMLAFGVLYLQMVLNLNPCPMCIVQRYCLILVGVFSALAAFPASRGAGACGGCWGWARRVSAPLPRRARAGCSGTRPRCPTCGRDLYGMIESFPLQRAIPMIFKGSGDCTAIDWTFLGGTIANWSFVWFVIFGLTILTVLLRLPRGRGGVMPA